MHDAATALTYQDFVPSPVIRWVVFHILAVCKNDILHTACGNSNKFGKVFRIGTVRYNWPMSAHASQASTLYRFGRFAQSCTSGAVRDKYKLVSF